MLLRNLGRCPVHFPRRCLSADSRMVFRAKLFWAILAYFQQLEQRWLRQHHRAIPHVERLARGSCWRLFEKWEGHCLRRRDARILPKITFVLKGGASKRCLRKRRDCIRRLLCRCMQEQGRRRRVRKRRCR